MGVIEFENVAFTYDGQRRALDGVNLDIERGSFVCVLGGNGSGKSTLAKHVNALLVPDEGSVRVLDADASDPGNLFFIRGNAGMVFQNPDDQIVSSVIEDDVAFGPENLGVHADELRGRVTRALEQVGLQGFEKKETAALSGGQKQRVAIAGVLAMEPQILMLDEASAMLDPRGRKGLARVCRELNDAGLTIVLITHFMEEATRADRVIVLDAGRVVLDGLPADVLTQAGRLRDLNLDVPFATRMSMELRENGVDVPVCLSADELASSLRALPADIVERIRGLLRERAYRPGSAGDAGLPDDCLTQSAEMSTGGLVSGLANGPVHGLVNGRADEREDADLQVRADAHQPMRAGVSGKTPNLQPPSSGTVLEFQNVSFTYQPEPKRRNRRNAVATAAAPADWGNDPSEYWALQDVSFTLERGEFFGIAGHTGSGKSTLIQLANGLLQPTAGAVLANGRNLSDKRSAAEARRDVGVVFQYPEHQLFAATVFDDVAFGPRNLGLAADEVEERVRAAMELVHLSIEELRDTSPFALSGGQQRRVAFAGVLAMQPTTLILDEPIVGLDPQNRRAFLELISDLHAQQGMTIAIVSHDMNDLARLCDRVLVLNQGKLFALGTPAKVFADEDRLRKIGLGVPDMVHLANLISAPDRFPAGKSVANQTPNQTPAGKSVKSVGEPPESISPGESDSLGGSGSDASVGNQFPAGKMIQEPNHG